MNEVIDILRKWQTEANSGHNDGYTRKHYQDKIDEVVDHLWLQTEKAELEDERPTGCDYGIGG